MFTALSQEVERIGNAVVNEAYLIHKEFGADLLEKVYVVCDLIFVILSAFEPLWQEEL